MDKNRMTPKQVAEEIRKGATMTLNKETVILCPTCRDVLLKEGHCYNPHCPDHQKKKDIEKAVNSQEGE